MSEIVREGTFGGDWRSWLRRRVVGLLAIKLLALTALWWLFFSPTHRPAADAQTVAARLFPSLQTPVHRSAAHD
ncbi:MAG: hypothetical protein KGJ55_11755 [Gammaproteobacteria bacterium]|nr:hypothetical protein [Gammaproteobacteria bacterium]